MELASAPELYPTAEEFAEPLRFVSGVAHLAAEHGILRITPPTNATPSSLEDVTAQLRSGGCSIWTRRQRVSRHHWASLDDARDMFKWPQRPKSLAAFHKLAGNKFAEVFPDGSSPSVEAIEVWHASSASLDCASCLVVITQPGCRHAYN